MTLGKNTQHKSEAWEPRVAKLETGLEILTRDVTNLAEVVREQSTNIEHELQKLAVAVTQAAGPRKTEWSVIISGLLLVMAIGSAVFWPLNQSTTNNKEAIARIEQKFDEHQKLDLHPVGRALLGRMEDQLKAHIEADNKERAELEDKLRRECSLSDAITEQKMLNIKSMVFPNNTK